MAGEIQAVFNSVYADGPSSNPTKPEKARIRNEVGRTIQNVIDGIYSVVGAGFSIKKEVRAASTSNVTLSSISNGSSFGGVTVATGDRIGFVGQSTASQNGIYVVQSSGSPERASDANSSAEISGMAFFVTAGTNAGKTFATTAVGTIDVGTTDLPFVLLFDTAALGSLPRASLVNSVSVSGANNPSSRIMQTSDNTIVLSGMVLGAFTVTGSTVLESAPISATYTFAEKETLWWNFNTNTFSTADVDIPPTTNSLPLLVFRRGRFVSGLLLPTLLQDQRFYQLKVLQCVNTLDGGAEGVICNSRDVVFTNAGFLGYNLEGDQIIDTRSTPITARYTLLTGQILVLNPVDGSVYVRDANAGPLGYREEVLFGQARGRMYAGWLGGYASLQRLDEVITDSAERRCTVYTGKNAVQTIVLVKDKILGFANTPDDHSAFGNIYVYDATAPGYPLLYTGTHNLGHATSASYCEETDTLMVGNGNARAGLYPRIDLFDNFYARITSGMTLNFNNTTVTPRLTINFFEVDGDGDLTKQIDDRGALYGCNACFVTKDEIIIFQGAALVNGRMGVRIVLGMGGNDFSDGTGSDNKRYGSFLSGKTSNQYNGTALVKRVYDGPHLGSFQGLIYNPGRGEVIVPLSRSSPERTAEAIGIRLTTDGLFEPTKTWRYVNYNSAGNYTSIETEGAVILNNKLILASNGSGWYEFPLDDAEVSDGSAMQISSLVPGGDTATYSTQVAVAEIGADNRRRALKEMFSPGGMLSFKTLAAAQTESVPAGIDRVYLNDLDVVRVRVDAEPASGGKHRSGDRYLPNGAGTDAVNGGWWADKADVGLGRFSTAALKNFRQRDWPQLPFTASTVDDQIYSHFPVIASTQDVLGILYHRGKNHTQSDAEAVCLSQKPAAGGVQNLVINGHEASGGSVSLNAGDTQVIIASDANDSARTFTVTGLLNGVPVTRTTSSGPNAGSVTLAGNIDVIQQVTVNGNTAGNITVGLLRIASDIAYRYSEDGGRSWSSRITLGNGISDGGTRYYYPALGTRKDGSLIAIYSAVAVPDGSTEAYFRTSIDGKTWTAQRPMQISGVTAPPLWAFYGQISRTPSGRLVVGAYNGDNNYVLVSDNDGESWTSVIQVSSSSPAYSEMAFAVIDELNWVSILRVDGSVASLRQFVTADGGATWTDLGETNLPSSGGYQSHTLSVVYSDGTPYLAFAYMARTVISSPPPNPDCICVRFAKADAALASATVWGPETVLVSGLAGRSGYPSLFVNTTTGRALMAYGQETADRAAKVLTKRVDLVSLIRQNVTAFMDAGGYVDPASWTPVLTCATPGDLAVTYSSQIGRVVKIGKLRICTFEVVATGFTYTTASGALRITGLPDVAMTEMQTLSGGLEWSGVTKSGFTQITPRLGANGSQINFRCSGSGQGATDLAVTDLPSTASGGIAKRFVGTVTYMARD